MDEDRDGVRDRFPQAEARPPGAADPEWSVHPSPVPGGEPLARGATEAEAWGNAADAVRAVQ